MQSFNRGYIQYGAVIVPKCCTAPGAVSEYCKGSCKEKLVLMLLQMMNVKGNQEMI